MANWYEPDQEARDAWLECLAGWPDAIRIVAERLTPWGLFRFKSTGHRVTIGSFDAYKNEEGALKVLVRVHVLQKFNQAPEERGIFQVDPEADGVEILEVDPQDLVECDLPGLGCMVN